MAPFGDFAPMDVRESSKKRRVREFVESWFLERCLAKGEQETSIDFGKRLSSEFMMPQKEKAKLVAAEALDGERKFSGASAAAAAAAETATDKIQTEKMDKAVVEMDKTEKIERGQETAVDNMLTEKMDKRAESDDSPAGANGKLRLPDEHVALVLAMPTETPIDIDDEDLSFITERAKLLNRSDEWIEKQKQRYRQRAALFNRINEGFVQMQDELVNLASVQSEEEYEANLAETQEYSNQLWIQYNGPERLAT